MNNSPKTISTAGYSQTEILCWSRMQAEAGQQLHEIIFRKELERRANHGIFCWGVGNAPNRCTKLLARDQTEIDAIFSVMKGRPRWSDVGPSLTLIWRKFIDHDGRELSLPMGSLVTSKGEPRSRAMRNHFALFCRSPSRLTLGDFGPFDPNAFRNLGEAGGAVGPSQVTALLRRTGAASSDAQYRVNLRAKLFGSYWAKLTDPIVMNLGKQRSLSLFVDKEHNPTTNRWLELVAELREDHAPGIGTRVHQLHLF